jgi:hypothetical protein
MLVCWDFFLFFFLCFCAALLYGRELGFVLVWDVGYCMLPVRLHLFCLSWIVWLLGVCVPLGLRSSLFWSVF